MAQELALTRPDPTMDEPTLRVLMAAADRYVKSGLLPAEVNTPQKALVIMTAGRELGVPATYALRNIHVVKGKPVCSAELLLALVRRSYGPAAIRVAKTTNTACTVQYREQGWDGVSEYSFTIEDARQAGVAGSNTWKSYPAAMLRARCISAVVRFAFPECIAGLYTPEEMGAEVVVTDEGHVQVIDSTATTPALTGDRAAISTAVETDTDRARIQEEWGTESPPCDKAHFLAKWHATVKGSRFEDDDTRHKFIGWFTDSMESSLSTVVDVSTTEEAEALIATITEQMDREAKSAAKRAEEARNLMAG
jgi:hypothetical protein